MDEPMITGESKPVSRTEGDQVTAGTVATDSGLRGGSLPPVMTPHWLGSISWCLMPRIPRHEHNGWQIKLWLGCSGTPCGGDHYRRRMDFRATRRNDLPGDHGVGDCLSTCFGLSHPTGGLYRHGTGRQSGCVDQRSRRTGDRAHRQYRALR